ncbi:MAG TPA: class I SAM-dependent methyltransferase [Thermoanaerobacterales bacterium]|nr:class I SAM-dependent methyltransferase [Thermoanaerobacterales bacterium]
MESHFDKLWKMESKNKKDQQKFWDSRAAEFNLQLASPMAIKETQQLLNFLKEKGAIEKSSTVLDIGCGAGKYALTFAKEAKTVVGTDISPKMIAFARDNAQDRGLQNIEFVQASWPEVNLKDLGWKRNFDLVFAAFCPGIDSAEALKQMIDASRKHCFMSGFAMRKDQVMEGFKKHLGIQSKSWGNQIYFSFNLLWQWGYYPEITYQDRGWTKEYDIEQMADILLIRFNDRVRKEDIIDYLKTISVNGKITEQITAKVAWLYWQV